MQRPNEKKKRKITDTAARLFATRPFHEVRLDDVAAAAQVGKGTLYVYFKSKDDLYRSLVLDALASLVHLLESQTSGDTPPQRALELIVRRLVRFAFDHPYVYELVRSLRTLRGRGALATKRRQLVAIIETTLRRGIRAGVWSDPHPELTALFVPGLVRSAVLYGPHDLDEQTLAAQILLLLRRGLANDGGAR